MEGHALALPDGWTTELYKADMRMYKNDQFMLLTFVHPSMRSVEEYMFSFALVDPVDPVDPLAPVGTDAQLSAVELMLPLLPTSTRHCAGILESLFKGLPTQAREALKLARRAKVMLSLQETMQAEGRADRALEFESRVAALAQEVYKKGDELCIDGEHGEAMEFYRKALLVYLMMGMRYIKYAVHQLGRLAVCMTNEKMFGEALVLAQNSLFISLKLKFKDFEDLVVGLMSLMAECYRETNLVPEALRLHTRALADSRALIVLDGGKTCSTEISALSVDTRWYVREHFMLGHCHLELDRKEKIGTKHVVKACEIFQKGVEHFKHMRRENPDADVTDMAGKNVLRKWMLGAAQQMYLKMRFAHALPLFLQCYDISEMEDSCLEQAMDCMYIAHCLGELHEYERALQWFSTFECFPEEERLRENQRQNVLLKALCLLGTDDAEGALVELGRLEKAGCEPAALGAYWVLMAECHLKLGRLLKAKACVASSEKCEVIGSIRLRQVVVRGAVEEGLQQQGETAQQHARDLLLEIENEGMPKAKAKPKRARARKGGAAAGKAPEAQGQEDCREEDCHKEACGKDCGKDGDATDECCVCLSAPRTHVFLPCGHVCVCEACADSVSKSTAECPLCRKPTVMHGRVFF